MKKLLIYKVVLFLLLVSTSLIAQDREGEITITTQRFEQVGNNVYVQMDIHAYNIPLKVRQTLVLTPQIATSGSFTDLPEVVLNGNQAHLMYKRTLRLYDENFLDDAYAVLKANRRTDWTITYNAVIPYEQWMSTSVLRMKEEYCGCGDARIPVNMREIPIQLERIEPPIENIVIQYQEREKHNTIHFPINKHTVLEDFSNNRQVIRDLDNFLDSLRNGHDIVIKRVYLMGYASPDGPYKFNEELARNRVNAFRDYMQKRYNLNSNIYQLKSTAEDWDGLIKEVENSNVVNKEQLLNILRNTPNMDQRERNMKTLDRGRTYEQLKSNQLPDLRRVDYIIIYDIK